MNNEKYGRDALTAWVKEQHAGQLIRKTDLPYFNHLIFVAEKVDAIIPLGYEIGLCHDLLEETDVTEQDLLTALKKFGYLDASAGRITTCVVELTDVFTKTTYPKLKKQQRKQKEAERLAFINTDAQTVKYADLIYNINWMVKYGGKKLPKYLERKKMQLQIMCDGNNGLRVEALALINQICKDMKV